jgi:hypothetical protein
MKRTLLKEPNGFVRPTETSLGNEIIMGQETVGVVWPGSHGSDKRVSEWRATNLNCQSLRVRIDDKLPDGSFKLHNDISAVSLVLGEPDPSLFNIPQDYAELKPSEFLHREADRLNMPVDKRTGLEKEADRTDAEYAKDH